MSQRDREESVVPEAFEVDGGMKEWARGFTNIDARHAAIRETAAIDFKAKKEALETSIRQKIEDQMNTLNAGMDIYMAAVRAQITANLEELKAERLARLESEYEAEKKRLKDAHNQARVDYFQDTRGSLTESLIPFPPTKKAHHTARVTFHGEPLRDTPAAEASEQENLNETGHIQAEDERTAPLEGSASITAGGVAQSFVDGPRKDSEGLEPRLQPTQRPHDEGTSEEPRSEPQSEPDVVMTNGACRGPNGNQKGKRKLSDGPDTELREAAKRAKIYNSPPVTPASEASSVQGAEKRSENQTISFREVFQDGQPEHKHMIVEHPPESGNFYILKCEEHMVHFGLKPLAGAAKHLAGAQHANLGKHYSLAIDLLGYRVLGCDEHLMARNNAMVQSAFKEGYVPFNMNRLTKNEKISQGFLSQTPAASPSAQKSGDDIGGHSAQPKASKPFAGTTNPIVGELYLGYWAKTKTRYPVMVLPFWGDISMTGLSGTLSGTGLVSNAPRCVRVNKSTHEVLGWQKGYEDGGPLVTKREFPVVYYDRKRQVGWLPAKHITPFDFEDPHPGAIPEYYVARDLYAIAKGFKDYETMKAVQPRLPRPEHRPGGDGWSSFFPNGHFSQSADDVRYGSGPSYPDDSGRPPQADAITVSLPTGGHPSYHNPMNENTRTVGDTGMRDTVPGRNGVNFGSQGSPKGNTESSNGVHTSATALLRSNGTGITASRERGAVISFGGTYAHATPGSVYSSGNVASPAAATSSMSHGDGLGGLVPPSLVRTPESIAAEALGISHGPELVTEPSRSQDDTTVNHAPAGLPEDGMIGAMGRSAISEQDMSNSGRPGEAAEAKAAALAQPYEAPRVSSLQHILGADISPVRMHPTEGFAADSTANPSQGNKAAASLSPTLEVSKPVLPPRPVSAQPPSESIHSLPPRSLMHPLPPRPVVQQAANEPRPASTVHAATFTPARTISGRSEQAEGNQVQNDAAVTTASLSSNPASKPTSDLESRKSPPTVPAAETESKAESAKPRAGPQYPPSAVPQRPSPLVVSTSAAAQGDDSSSASPAATAFIKAEPTADRAQEFEITSFYSDNRRWIREPDGPFLRLSIDIGQQVAETGQNEALEITVDPRRVGSMVSDAVDSNGTTSIELVMKESLGGRQRLVFATKETSGRLESGKVQARRFCQWVKSVNSTVAYRSGVMNANRRFTPTGAASPPETILIS